MADQPPRETGMLRSGAMFVLFMVVVGIILALLFAAKGAIPFNLLGLAGMVFITVLAGFVCLLLDRSKKRGTDDFARAGKTPPPSEWADRCEKAYADRGTWDRWVPAQGRIEGLGLDVEQVLEDRSVKCHHAILIAEGSLPQDADSKRVRSALDEWCRAVLSPKRLRGLGVGILLRAAGGPAPDMNLATELVDDRARHPATMQWIVWSCEDSKTLVGVHMPMDGMTTQCFVDVCLGFREKGYALDCRPKLAKGLMKLALAIQKKTPWWLGLLGP